MGDKPVEPVPAQPAVQNRSVGLQDVRVGVELNSAPVVQAGTEGSTIACQMKEGCFSIGCGREWFPAKYEAGKVSLSKEEFDAAIADINAVLEKNVLDYILCPFHWLTCDAFDCSGYVQELQTECDKQTAKFSEKNVHFYIKTKTKVVVGWDGPDVDDNVFLLVMQK